MARRGISLLALLLVHPTFAQESASFMLREQFFNAGGNPTDASVLTSTSYRIRLDAIGEGVVGTDLSSESYRIDVGFVGAYPPPSEVRNLRFNDVTTFQWDAERSVGTYNSYRGLLSTLSGLTYGTCQQSGLMVEATIDPTSPPVGDGYFYLVTARNRINEEGTKGFRSSGEEHPNPAPCP